MERERRKLLLVDGSAILHRAYHAMPGLTDRQGRSTGAVYGFVRMLLRAMKDLQPTHVAVAFDRPEPTFRKEMYIAYQAQRPELDEELVEQFVRVRELLGAMEVPVYEKAGFEADDIIGSIVALVAKSEKLKAKKYSEKVKSQNPESRIQNPGVVNFETIILTGDKDMMQLVDDQVKLYLPVKGVSEAILVGTAEVEEKLGVRPDQVVDLKALTGDPSDNYPGVPGVGPKTAIALLDEFGSFEGVYEALEGKKTLGSESRVESQESRVVISESVKMRLIAGRQSGELSLRLAKIRKDVKIEFDLDKCRVVVNNPGKLARALEDYGFKSLAKQMGLEEKSGGEQIRLV